MNAMIQADWQRLRTAPVYLITLGVSTQHGHSNGGIVEAAYPQDHAVVDDFGTLVIVRGWQ